MKLIFDLILIFSIGFISAQTPKFTLEEAQKLIQLPLHCVETEYPNKLSQTLANEQEMGTPKTLHPAFYGCFDWHSAVHGYWSIVVLLKKFPELDNDKKIKDLLRKNLSAENIEYEFNYFMRESEKSYERTYGWVWYLKLQEETDSWDTEIGRELSKNLQPLSDLIVLKYIEYLPKLIYPIRTGEHINTAFGLSFAYDYALSSNNLEFQNLILQSAIRFYLNDKNCPLTWEPSGYDFLSPCLEEIDLMRKVLDKENFMKWISDFYPELLSKKFTWETAKVSDRTDGKLVHLDGLNFSRAWVFYGLAAQYKEFKHLVPLANQHFHYSAPNLFGDTYEGGHWLGSFAIYALTQAESN